MIINSPTRDPIEKHKLQTEEDPLDSVYGLKTSALDRATTKYNKVFLPPAPLVYSLLNATSLDLFLVGLRGVGQTPRRTAR